jgi:hypothetical protein
LQHLQANQKELTGTSLCVVGQRHEELGYEVGAHLLEQLKVDQQSFFQSVGKLHANDPDELGQMFLRKYLLGTN